MNNDQDESLLLPKNCLNIFSLYTNAESLRHKLDTLRAEACDMWSADTILHGSTTRFSGEDNASLCIIAQKYIELLQDFNLLMNSSI